VLWRGSAGVRPARRRAPRFSAAYAHMMALEAMGRIEAMHLGDDEDAVQLRGAVGLLVDMLRDESARIAVVRQGAQGVAFRAVGDLAGRRGRGGQRGGRGRGGRGRGGRGRAGQ